MDKVFEPFLGHFLQNLIDNFGVYNDKASHLTKLEVVFQCSDGSRVILSLEKITIDFSEGKMVIHMVSKDRGSHIFQKFPFPTINKTFQGFLGIMGYYQRFIHMFATKTRPLT
jgi:hypothetical protein